MSKKDYIELALELGVPKKFAVKRFRYATKRGLNHEEDLRMQAVLMRGRKRRVQYFAEKTHDLEMIAIAEMHFNKRDAVSEELITDHKDYYFATLLEELTPKQTAILGVHWQVLSENEYKMIIKALEKGRKKFKKPTKLKVLNNLLNKKLKTA